MVSEYLSVCLVFLALVPGVLCKYDYNIGGMVAAAVVGFFMLIFVIVMIFTIILWKDWYERKMMLQGIPRQPRRYWGLFDRAKSPSTLLSTPRSDRKLQNAVTKHLIENSRSTTLTRAVDKSKPVGSKVKKDEWLNQMPNHPEYVNPQYGYEEKVQTITFEPEEEAVIVADLLPANDLRRSQQTKPVYEPPPRNVEYASTQKTQEYQEFRSSRRNDENMVYVAYNGEKSDYPPHQQFRHTIATTPYHVKLGQIDEPSPVQSRMFVPPTEPATISDEHRIISSEPVVSIPTQIPDETPGPSGLGRESPVVVSDNEPREAVVMFKDSDDEAGLISNRQVNSEDDVLF